MINYSELPEEAKLALSTYEEFEAREFIDSGANGYVLLGRHKVLKKNVAIKIYFHETNEIQHEPVSIVSMNHPNVLKVYDARKVGDNCSFFLMPAANEGDLSQFLQKYTISTQLSLQLLCQLLSGISALHSEPFNLVHRDLKPENLLVDDDKIIIADFGSVKKVDDSNKKAPASKHSILFRPPEAFGEDAFFDYSSDVYQSGIIGYLLFGGRLSNNLLDYLNDRELIHLQKVKRNGDTYAIETFIDSCIEKRIKKSQLLDWNSTPFYIPSFLKTILKRAIAHHGKRYSSVSEFLAALTKIRSKLPDWIHKENDYYLNSWNGYDFIFTKKKNRHIVKKKKVSSSLYRVDNSFSGNSFKEIYNNFERKIIK